MNYYYTGCYAASLGGSDFPLFVVQSSQDWYQPTVYPFQPCLIVSPHMIVAQPGLCCCQQTVPPSQNFSSLFSFFALPQLLSRPVSITEQLSSSGLNSSQYARLDSAVRQLKSSLMQQ